MKFRSLFVFFLFVIFGTASGAEIFGETQSGEESVAVLACFGNGSGEVYETETTVLYDGRRHHWVIRDDVRVTVRDLPSDSVIIHGRSYHFRNFRPTDRNYPDVAEVPKVARFAEVNTSLVVLISVGIIVFILLWVSYSRCRDTQPASGLDELPLEELLKKETHHLRRFCDLYQTHPHLWAVYMEVGRRFYQRQDYAGSMKFFQMAVRLDPSAKNPEAHFYMGHSLRQLDYLCDAIDEWVACTLDDPQGKTGPWSQDALYEARRWRAYQVVQDREVCRDCGAENRLTDFRCQRCSAHLKRTLVVCNFCGKKMIKEAQICIHCLPDEIKAEVARGMGWPIFRTTTLDWEAQLIKSCLAASDIPCVLTGEKGSGIPLTVGHLGAIHIRVPAVDIAQAEAVVPSAATLRHPG